MLSFCVLLMAREGSLEWEMDFEGRKGVRDSGY